MIPKRLYPRSNQMNLDVRDNSSIVLTGWSPFVIMGNTMPPRDPDDDEDDEENEPDQPPFVREPGED
jgi:hypothetical protein